MKLNYFNYCAMAICIALLISIRIRRMTRSKVERYFLTLVLIAMISVFFDIAAVQLDNMGPGNVILKYVFHTGYLWFHNFSTPAYIMYMITLGDLWHRARKYPVRICAMAAPFLAVTAVLIVNFFTPVVFYLDANDAYTRGFLFWILYLSAAVYISYGLAFLIRFRKLFEKRLLVSIYAIFVLQIAAVVVQMFRPAVLVEMFGQTLSILLIGTIIQRPEERIDNATGLGKFTVFVDDMKRCFINGKEFDLILINIGNYYTIHEFLGYNRTRKLLMLIADKLGEVNRRMGTYAEIYYLGEGRYGISVDRRYQDRTEKMVGLLNDLLKSGIQINHMDINIIAHICMVKCPEDISDFETLIAFDMDFSTTQYTGEILRASDVLQKDHYDLMRQMDRIIESALANHRFTVYYQPIYSVEEQRFNSAEALLRLNDEKFGFISPEIFIPAAEKSGAIHKIGDYVLEEVCKFISSKDFDQLGMEYIEVNLSVVQCMQRDLTDKILRILDRYQVSPSKINLEITETAASNSQRILEDNIRQLTDAGLKFSLDDFGTGYSNMRRVASLPLTLVKLDKTFTGTEDSPNMEIVLQNTIRMLKDMNMKIVVEGVETQNMVQQFSDLECEYIQGYFYSKPIPQDEFVSFMRQANQQKS